MNKLKIAIVISTTRATRFGHKPAQWVKDIAAERDDQQTKAGERGARHVVAA